MTHRATTAATLAAGLLGMLPCAAIGDSVPSPAPSASPLKTIIEVHSSILCQTLQKAVEPTLGGLMKDDSILEVSNKALAKMFADDAAGAKGTAQNDRLFLRNAAGALAHNLKAIADLLGHNFPQDANANAQASEVLMKSQLQAVASAQNDALNLIEGYMQTEDMGRARDEYPGGHQLGANEVNAPGHDDWMGYRTEFHNANDPTTPFIDIAGLDGTSLHGVTPKVAQPAPVVLLDLTRSRIANLEEPASMSVIAAAQICSSQGPH